MNARKWLTYLSIALVVLALAGCIPQAPSGTETPAAPTLEPAAPTTEPTLPPAVDPLAGTSWVLESLGPSGAEDPAVAAAQVTLNFDTGGVLGGNAGCNTYGGGYRVNGDLLFIEGVFSTLMACADQAVMDQEMILLNALQGETRFELSAESLVITADDGETHLTFRPGSAEPTPAPDASNPLAGSSWSLHTLGMLDIATTVVPGSAPTLSFDNQGGVSGSSGCNTFSGSYQVDQTSLAFGPLVTTEMACLDEALMQQETNYYAALGRVAGFLINEDRLTLTDANGQMALIFDRGIAESTAAPETPGIVPETTPTPEGNPAAAENYLDDRSTASGLIWSYFNAINRHEYLRAYSYYRDPETELGAFEDFEAGYQDTAAVTVTLGQLSSDAGAGQLYTTVPALLQAEMADGSSKAFAACYLLHLSQPAIQEPPFIPLSIERGETEEIVAGSPADALAGACQGPDFAGGNPLEPTPLTNREDLSANNYLDERSDAVLALRSMVNALNRSEYARAFSYWKEGGDGPTYEAFTGQFANLAAFNLMTGEVIEDVAAGNFYYQVPVVLTAETAAGETQIFAGCYLLHQSNPGVQATPPFQPMGIRMADIQSVAAPADPQELLSRPCALP